MPTVCEATDEDLSRSTISLALVDHCSTKSFALEAGRMRDLCVRAMLTYFILVEVLLVQEIILECWGFDEMIGTLKEHEFYRFDHYASLVG